MEKIKKFLIFISVLAIYVTVEKFFGSSLTLLVPVVLVLFSYWLVKKIIAPSKQTLFLSYSLLVGHILWAILGIIIILSYRNRIQDINELFDPYSFIDIAVLIALTIWFIIRPGLISGIFMLIFLLVEILFMSYNVSELENKVLIKGQWMHLTLYAVTFISVIQGLYMHRKINLETKGENRFVTPSDISHE